MENNNNSNSNTEAPDPKQVVAFFVPNHVASFVTELLELGLSSTPGVSVKAGILTDVPKHFGVPLSYMRSPDGTTLPDLNVSSSDCTTQPTAAPKTITKIRVMPRSKFYRWKKFKKPSKSKTKKSFPESDTHCCPAKMVVKLEQKYGTAKANFTDGSTSAPRLMIQYPDLPYMVPVSKNFDNLGVPRKVVDFCYNAVFTADTSDDQLPILKSD